ncbi:MAG: hypothetical protein HQ541_12200 [Mariniphaga sp.]|nr:hypothetical protein [Mariniphaga sp.]
MKDRLPYISTNQINRLYISISVIALLSGGLFYILFRPAEPVFFDWFRSLGVEKWLSLIRQKSLSFNLFLPEWLVYSLPSGLWAFAYSILITGIWWQSKSRIKYFWFASILLLVIGWEILQLTGVVSGAYSFGDILAGLVGVAAGVLIGIKLIKPKYHEKETI